MTPSSWHAGRSGAQCYTPEYKRRTKLISGVCILRASWLQIMDYSLLLGIHLKQFPIGRRGTPTSQSLSSQSLNVSGMESPGGMPASMRDIQLRTSIVIPATVRRSGSALRSLPPSCPLLRVITCLHVDHIRRAGGRAGWARCGHSPSRRCQYHSRRI